MFQFWRRWWWRWQSGLPTRSFGWKSGQRGGGSKRLVLRCRRFGTCEHGQVSISLLLSSSLWFTAVVVGEKEITVSKLKNVLVTGCLRKWEVGFPGVSLLSFTMLLKLHPFLSTHAHEVVFFMYLNSSIPYLTEMLRTIFLFVSLTFLPLHHFRYVQEKVDTAFNHSTDSDTDKSGDESRPTGRSTLV